MSSSVQKKVEPYVGAKVLTGTAYYAKLGDHSQQPIRKARGQEIWRTGRPDRGLVGKYDPPVCGVVRVAGLPRDRISTLLYCQQSRHQYRHC